jgi:hypothetical protein
VTQAQPTEPLVIINVKKVNNKTSLATLNMDKHFDDNYYRLVSLFFSSSKLNLPPCVLPGQLL